MNLFKGLLLPLDTYLEQETAKFFYFKNNKVYRSLDNPRLDDMKNAKNPGK